MHPFFTHPRWLGTYLVVWAVLATAPAAVVADAAGLSFFAAYALALPATLALAVVTLPTWYVCRATPLKPSTLPRLLTTHALLAALWSGVWVACLASCAWLWRLVSVPQSRPIEVTGEGGVLFAVGALFYLLIAAFHYLLLSLDAARTAERRQEALAASAREAELKALKAQIHPHFLFNSLNAISALVTRDPAQARDMCVKLADFLRHSLGASDRPEVTLAEELALTELYLGVEKIRLGTRLRVDVDVARDCYDCLVPPLLLQPLVENAVTHGIATLALGGRLAVLGHCAKGRLLLTVENPFDPDERRHKSGRGLANVRGRIEARYGKEASLSLERGQASFRVSLELPATRG